MHQRDYDLVNFLVSSELTLHGIFSNFNMSKSVGTQIYIVDIVAFNCWK